MTTVISFARRLNRDSSIDSICTKCCETVASANCENELAGQERGHLCDPSGQFVRNEIEYDRCSFRMTFQPSKPQVN